MRQFRAQSSRAGLESLARAGLGLDEYMDEAMALIRTAVPADGACLSTVDPSTLTLSVAHRHDLDSGGGMDFFFYEYAVDDDFSRFADLARRGMGTGILHDETRGDPLRSDRFRNVVRPLIGAEHELRGVARHGPATWAAFALYRTTGGPGFNQAEAEFLHMLGGTIADGVRAAIVTSTVDADTTALDGPAILLFDRSGALAHATDAGSALIATFDDDSEIPGPVAAVLSRIRENEDSAPVVRAQDRSGRWLVFRATRFRAHDGSVLHYAVTIEPATPPDVVPLLISAYGLTPRETRIVQAMMRGDATQAIAQRLHLSPYTVQDHFKSIFLKLGVSSRREVASRLVNVLYADADLD